MFVEYAKAGPDDLLIEITAHNRGPDEAPLHLLPTLWFRHTWSWAGGTAVPSLRQESGGHLRADHEELGPRWLYCDADAETLFTENDTNNEKIFGSPNASPYVKDGIDRYVVGGETGAVNPDRTGTKAAVHHVLTIPAGQSATVRLRLTAAELPDWTGDFDAVMTQRRTEADEFYDGITTPDTSADERRLVRQALAGMLWSKQYYYLDVERWLSEHGLDPLAADPRCGTATGTTWSTTRSCRCRTPGSTRGSRPGTSPSTPSPCRWSISPSPRASWTCCCAASTCTPTARSRRTNGTSGTSTRPCTPGPLCSSTSWRSTAPARPTAPSWRTPSRS